MNTTLKQSSLRNLRHTLFTTLQAETSFSPRHLNAALNRAEAIAWATPFPQLVLPLLAVEVARENLNVAADSMALSA